MASSDGAWWQPELYAPRLEAVAAAASTPAAPLDAAGAAQLVGQLVSVMRVHLGAGAEPSAVRLPAALLRDTTPGGGLASVLAAALSFRAANADAAALDLAAPQHRQQALAMLQHVRRELQASGALPPLRVRFAEGVPAADLPALQAIVARFGGEVLVPDAATAATHVVSAAPAPAAEPGVEAFRLVEVAGERALVHVWCTPDSADAWVSLAAAGGGEAAPRAAPPPGGWQLPLAWLRGSDAAHELLNEGDYDTAYAAALEAPSASGAKRKRAAAAAAAGGAEPAPKAARSQEGPAALAPGVVRRATGVTHPDVVAASGGDGAAAHPAGLVPPRIENISQGQVPPGAPARPAQPSGPVAARPAGATATGELHDLPAYASWFSFTAVHELERKGCSEFFGASTNIATKNASSYRNLRNAIVQRFRENPGRKLTFTECRAGLVGDVNSLQRVFSFLEHWGIINHLSAKGGAAAPARPPPPTTAVLAAVPPGAAPEALRLGAAAGAPRPKHALYDFEPPRPTADAVAVAGRRAPLSGAGFACNACGADLAAAPRYHCLKLPDYDLCGEHYREGRFPGGTASGDYVRLDAGAPPPAGDGGAGEGAAARWTDAETLLLLEGVELHGDNWDHIASHVGTKSKPQCVTHFLSLPIEDRFLDDMEGRPLSLDGGTAAAPPGPPLLPFEDAGNPVMAQMAFLTAIVGPRVAAAAAAAALQALEAEQAVTDADAAAIQAAMGGGGEAMDTDGGGAGASAEAGPPSKAVMCHVAAQALAAGAIKAKLLADQEARDIQRLVVGVIDTQLRKMELKFRQLEELDDALRKEGDTADASRASLAQDRACMAAYKMTLMQAQQAAAQQAAQAAHAAHQQAAQHQAAQQAAAAAAQQQQQQQQQQQPGKPADFLPPLAPAAP